VGMVERIGCSGEWLTAEIEWGGRENDAVYTHASAQFYGGGTTRKGY